MPPISFSLPKGTETIEPGFSLSNLPDKYVGNDQTIRQMEPGGDSLVGAAEHFSSMNPSDPYPSEFAFFMEDIV